MEQCKSSGGEDLKKVECPKCGQTWWTNMHGAQPCTRTNRECIQMVDYGLHVVSV